MSYFSQAHNSVRYVLAADSQAGLRRCQIGAVHAISAHFAVQTRPAVVVLPTGSGKTAVLMLTPYVLCAERVLVITPSRFVRDQITRDYCDLRTLKLAQALPQDLCAPRIFENKHPIRSTEVWETLRLYDVVISTPNSSSPAHKGIAAPAEDLFDLVLIDEAHHSPAPTWNAVIDAFPRARCVLFTATPFRRDAKEIKGRYIFTYPIQRAFDDGIYGEMTYVSVDPAVGISPDVALARETERVFQEDRGAGLTHVLMVRADTRTRANELAGVYRQHTTLRLEIVHSGVSQSGADKAVARLRQGELDGVICVNMLGEGFDLPNLKIAALHAPHRSLAVTLQFLGRFARVTGDRLGDAKFLAVQSEIKDDLAELYQESKAWGRRIRAIGQERIGEEVHIREFLEEFRIHEHAEDETLLEELSLYGFSVFNHVKVYQVHGDVDLQAFPQLDGFITEKVWVNDPYSTVVFLLREEQRPKWAPFSGLKQVEHHLFVVYFDAGAQLLFICATCKEEPVYREIASIFVTGQAQPLSLSKINRALRGVTGLELFNVGMRNRATGTVAETYRQMAGAAVHDAIDKGDAVLYHRGHVFGRGRVPSGVTTLGLSSLSKIWRLEHTKIPGLIEWCKSLARDIENAAPFMTGIALDYLDAGRDITALPEEIVLAADWQDAVYQNPPLIRYTDSTGIERLVPVLDFDLSIDRPATSANEIVFEVRTSDAATHLNFTLVPFPHFSYVDSDQPRLQVERGHHSTDFADYLTDNPLRFHLADGSLLEGCQFFEASAEAVPYDAGSLMQPVDWSGAGVDPQREYGTGGAALRSIHDWLRDELVASDAVIVFYDHRPGECADFLVLDETAEGQLAVKFFHCKGAGGPTAGDRVNDLDEVCGQATRSAQWRSKKVLMRHVRRRFQTGSVFCKGDLNTFCELIEGCTRSQLPLEIRIVQPGASKSCLSAKMASLLSVSSRGLVAAGCPRLRVICSS